MLWNQIMGAVDSRYARTGEKLVFGLSNTGLQMFRRETDLVCFPTRLQMGQCVKIKEIPRCIQQRLGIGSTIEVIYLEDVEGEADLLYLVEQQYNGRIIDLDDMCCCHRPSCESADYVHNIFAEMIVVVGEIIPEDELYTLSDELPFLLDLEYPVAAEFTPF